MFDELERKKLKIEEEYSQSLVVLKEQKERVISEWKRSSN